MFRALLARRWPTSVLAAVALVVGALAYVYGRNARQSRPVPAGLADAHATATSNRGDASAKIISSPNGSPARGADADASRDDRWQRWSAGSRTPETEQEMIAFIVTLAARDPQHAMALARGENNLRLRELLRNAALRGWARTAPDEAANEAVKLSLDERGPAMEALFAGAAHPPERAVKLGERLCAENPALASDYGQFLIAALNEAGAYEAAVRFAAVARVPENRTSWLTEAFYEFAAHQPRPALETFRNLPESVDRRVAFQGLAAGWARADPAGLAAYAIALPAGETRATALTQALPQWVTRDATAASEWISHFDPNADFDAGVAAVALLPVFVENRPQVALGWAENISDTVLRANTLRLVAQQWAKKDADGVRAFLAATPNLPTDERTALADGLNPPPDS